MKLAAVAIALFVAAPALAQSAGPAPAPSTVAQPSLDTPIEAIVANPKAKAVLDADFGADLTQHPMYESFKGMSLNEVAPMSGGKVTPELLRKLDADFKALK